jgi:hypothetical protein
MAYRRSFKKSFRRGGFRPSFRRGGFKRRATRPIRSYRVSRGGIRL